MKALTKKDLERIFSKAGGNRKPCKHHQRGSITGLDGKVLVYIHYSFGNGDVPNSVLHRFRKSLTLSVSEFEDFRKCELSRKQFLKLLKSRL